MSKVVGAVAWHWGVMMLLSSLMGVGKMKGRDSMESGMLSAPLSSGSNEGGSQAYPRPFRQPG